MSPTSLFALFLTATNLNVFSMMAVIMLVGIVVNNAILIPDYTSPRAGGAGAGEPAGDRRPA